MEDSMHKFVLIVTTFQPDGKSSWTEIEHKTAVENPVQAFEMLSHDIAVDRLFGFATAKCCMVQDNRLIDQWVLYIE
jgi:hypothetical protein